MHIWLSLAAGLAAAQGLDYSAPGYWTRSYSIPSSYCERRITVTTADLGRLIKAAEPCRFNENPGSAMSLCHLTKADSDQIVKILEHGGSMTAYSQTCSDPPEYPELYDKRDNLLSEWTALDLSTTAPAIAGLMSAQFSTLDEIIKRHEAAKTALLRISLTEPDFAGSASWPPTAPENGAGIKWAAAIPHKVGTPHPDVSTEIAWRRTTMSACDQVSYIEAAFQRESPEADAKRISAVRRFGRPFETAGCATASRVSVAAAVFSDRDDRTIKSAIIGLGAVRSLSVLEDSPPENFITDDVRFDRLSAELDQNNGALKAAPHVRAFVKAEIERVRESAEEVRRLRKGRLVFVTLVD